MFVISLCHCPLRRLNPVSVALSCRRFSPMTRKAGAPIATISVLFLLIALTLLRPVALAQKTNTSSPSSEGVTFKRAVDYDSGGQLAWTLLVTDVNGDGKPDLLVLNNNGEPGSGDGSVEVLLSNGSGGFRRTVQYDSGGVYATGFAVADLNGDGKPDLVAASDSCSSSGNTACVGVLLGNG